MFTGMYSRLPVTLWRGWQIYFQTFIHISVEQTVCSICLPEVRHAYKKYRSKGLICLLKFNVITPHFVYLCSRLLTVRQLFIYLFMFTDFIILTFSWPWWLIFCGHSCMGWVVPLTYCCRPWSTQATCQSHFLFWGWP